MRKVIITFLACTSLIIGAVSCNDNKNNSNQKSKDMKTENNQNTEIFPTGNRGSSDWFTGEVYVQSLVNPNEMEDLYSVGQVTFMPGGRTHRHTHPMGQTLLVLEGKGWYQERGKPARELVKGSVVAIPKDVEHWHGASADTKLVHIAISNMKDDKNVIWMSPVDDKEYSAVN